MIPRRFRSTLVFTCLLWPAVSAAQEHAGYVGGGLKLSPWTAELVSGGGASTSYANSTTDRLIAAATGEAGWFVTPATAIGVEVSMPVHRVEISQFYGYVFSSRYDRRSRYRELAMLGIVRHDVMTRRRVRVAVVGGGGLVRADSIERYAPRPLTSSAVMPFGEETRVTRATWALNAGADASLPVAPRLSLVPQFRLLMVSRGNRALGGDRTSFTTLGLRTFVYSAGIGIRLEF